MKILPDDKIEVQSVIGRNEYCKTHFSWQKPKFTDAGKARAGEKQVAIAQIPVTIEEVFKETDKELQDLDCGCPDGYSREWSNGFLDCEYKIKQVLKALKARLLKEIK